MEKYEWNMNGTGKIRTLHECSAAAFHMSTAPMLSQYARYQWYDLRDHSYRDS